jgi:uncharacterized Zn-binding protein involved in type VI secretion
VHAARLRGLLACLEDVPHILCSVTELATCDAGTEVEVADGDAVILEVVGKVIAALGHGTDKDGNALVLVEAGNVVADAHNLRVEAEGDLAAVGGQVVGDGILNDFDQLFLRRGGADLVSVKQLHHQTCESLEGSRNAHSGRHPDEDVLCRLDVDLQLASLVDWRVEQGEQTLSPH